MFRRQKKSNICYRNEQFSSGIFICHKLTFHGEISTSPFSIATYFILFLQMSTHFCSFRVFYILGFSESFQMLIFILKLFCIWTYRNSIFSDVTQRYSQRDKYLRVAWEHKSNCVKETSLFLSKMS